MAKFTGKDGKKYDTKDRPKGMSEREYWAEHTGRPKKEYKKDDKKDDKATIEAEKAIRNNAKEDEERARSDAATTAARLQEDMNRIMELSGIQATRATEDYLTNIANLEENKETALADLNEYVSTQRERTQEDLDTALAKEERRFTLEMDRVNTSLADTGMTFSERKDEKIAQEGNAMNVADANRAARRSFSDIARYEAVKTHEITTAYNRGVALEETKKNRTLEDIMNNQQDSLTAGNRRIEDTQTNLEENLDLIDRNKDQSLLYLEMQNASIRQNNQNRIEDTKFYG